MSSRIINWDEISFRLDILCSWNRKWGINKSGAERREYCERSEFDGSSNQEGERDKGQKWDRNLIILSNSAVTRRHIQISIIIYSFLFYVRTLPLKNCPVTFTSTERKWLWHLFLWYNNWDTTLPAWDTRCDLDTLPLNSNTPKTWKHVGYYNTVLIPIQDNHNVWSIYNKCSCEEAWGELT
jgi:hypothetical protein